MRKHRQCPHCKSKKGFSFQYLIKGSGMAIMDYNGNEIHSERDVFDDLPNDVTCLGCKRDIEFDKVQTDK